ncbi:hypothetical protein BDN72DRAFT_848026 [Pluteus cervinus]|uniref:Uncharacterized protein n=1 Tax=Pluteus cervinus TaxID=181527 RepID=A0ACD3AC55_9AGAR|nr:hypothetical protein BDN72DRAFT_848026 [Pluteus cervinus]
MTLQLPGYGLVLDAYHNKKTFFHALSYEDTTCQMPLIPLREFTMLRLMNKMTDKIGWEKKVLDPNIAAKWKQEALNTPGADITEAMVDWCIAEVQYKAQIFQSTNSTVVYTGDVVKSDTIIPESTRLALIDAIKPLEDILDNLKDWHPHSDEKVLDLVHPSLFPLVYGKTRILSEGGTTLEDCIKQSGGGEMVPTPAEPENTKTHWTWTLFWPSDIPRPIHKPYSMKFQWLPCDVDISNNQTKITSYINNLHPEHHKPLYGLIEQIIDFAIPLWNVTLSAQRTGFISRIKYDEVIYDPDPESWPKTEGPQREEGEEDRDYWWRRADWAAATRRVVIPDAGVFVPPAYDNEDDKGDEKKGKVDLRKEFGQGLQVIVKLANIALTPEKPEYSGGTWHVEGQLNEHICASAIYYYDSSNTTTSRLSFRQRVVNEPSEITVSYEQHHKDWLLPVFGCTSEGPPTQDIGSVETRQGRLLTFPNQLQHKVEPFKLEDPTKPGYRKILALFLVDPHTKIISTKNVPCQRMDWWTEALSVGELQDVASSGGIHSTGGDVNRFAGLPAELKEQIFDKVDGFPITLEEAKRLRLELMQERSAFVETQDGLFRQGEISLCEH